MPVNETLETSEALRAHVGITTGAVFANAVYSRLFTPAEAKRVTTMDAGEAGVLVTEAKAVGLDLDNDDIDALLGYGRFLEARRSIQTRHLKDLTAGIADPVIELPFLFSAGLALPDIETLADRVELEIEGL
jgi:hypothetical protein